MWIQNFFAASHSKMDEGFAQISFFSIFFEKKKNWKNWNFLKKLWLQKFSAATHSKMDENWLFCCCFQNVQLVFRYFLAVPRYQKLRKTRCFAAIFKLFALLFSNCDEFQIFFEKFLKIFWKNPKISENFSNPVIFCCQPFKNGWKLVVSLLFSIFSASFSLLLAVPRWKTKCFAAIFKLFAFLFSNFDEFQKMFRNELIKKKNEKIEKKIFFLKNCDSRDFLLPAIQKWMKTSCFAAVFKMFS